MSDWRTITDDRERYKAYLCSREWAVLRNEVRKRCGGICERCKHREMECVHHLTYARKYEERMEDLAGWCNACHDFTHGKSDFDPAAQQDPDPKKDCLSLLDFHTEKIPWITMRSVLLFGIEIYGRMGIDWMMRAADGEFQRDEITGKYLEELVKRRRKEQGIT
jgi:hypothetical protein